MRKDPTEFRKRFEEYKNGKMPYENGLPKYENGTPQFSVEDALQYIMNIENKYKVGLNNGIWRRPTDPKKYDVNQIAYGLDTRQEHNAIVYNFLKNKGRLDDPWLTEKEAHDLMLLTFNAKKYLMDKFVSKYGNNLSLMGYNRVASMLWHGHPFKMMNNPDSITGKALVNAISSGDRDMETVFDAYYMHPANAKLFKARIAEDHRLRNLHPAVTITQQNPQSNYIQTVANNTANAAYKSFISLVNKKHNIPNDSKVLLPQGEYFDWRNMPEYDAPIKEVPKVTLLDYLTIPRAPETISNWRSPDSPSEKVHMPDLKQEMDRYNAMMDIFGWNNDSKKKFGLPPLKSLLPSLDEMLLDQTKDYFRDVLLVPQIHPLGGFKNGKVPYRDDDYDYARAVELGYTPDETGHMPSRDWKTGMYLKHPTHPTIMKSIVTDLGEGYIPWYNPKDGQIYSHRFPDDLPKHSCGKLPKFGGGLFPFAAQLFNIGANASDSFKAATRQRLYNNVTPWGYNIPNAAFEFLKGLREFSSSAAKEALWAKYLGFPQFNINDSNTKGNVDDWIIESPYTPSMGGITYGKKAFRLNPAKFNTTYAGSSGGPLNDENIRTYFKKRLEQNRNNISYDEDFGNSGLGYYTMSSGKDDNGYYISYYDDWDINPLHGKSALKWTQIFPDALKNKGDIFKELIGANPFTLYDRRYLTEDEWRSLGGYKNGKLPGFSNGKIHINPANRGKFNATKKRTGKTTEELTHSSNPLTRKRAIFALNAKKWHHK